MLVASQFFMGSEQMNATSAAVRERILSAAIELLVAGGRDAVTTRAVAAAAGVQAPALYRLFGDKRGLLDAVAEHGFALYLGQKVVRAPADDPIEDLRAGWDLHVEFGLANPAVYALMYGDPRPGVSPPAAVTAEQHLHVLVRRLAVAGLLRVSEARAAHLVHAAGCGMVFTLLAMPEDQRDLGLSAIAREAVVAAVTTGGVAASTPGAAAAAIALRAVLPQQTTLTSGEQHLMQELLERVARGPS